MHTHTVCMYVNVWECVGECLSTACTCVHARVYVCLLLVAYKFGWLTNSDIFSAAFWALIMMGSYTPTHTHTLDSLFACFCVQRVWVHQCLRACLGPLATLPNWRFCWLQMSSVAYAVAQYKIRLRLFDEQLKNTIWNWYEIKQLKDQLGGLALGSTAENVWGQLGRSREKDT